MNTEKEKTALCAATHKAVTNEEQENTPITSSYLYDNFPMEIKQYPNWLVRKGKVPYSPLTGEQANKPVHCSSYSVAMSKVCNGEYDGLGFQFEGTPYTGIDIDHCINEKGEWSELALQAFIDFSSYTELSPSGTGIHIIVKGEIPAAVKNSRNGIEIYSTGRYFTMTGDKVIQSVPYVANNRQNILDVYYDTFRSNTTGNIATIGDLISLEPRSNDFNIRAVIENARNFDNSGKFKALFDEGDLSLYNNDHSAADMALLVILAYWTKDRPQLMHDVFNQSALAQRKKWQEGNAGNPIYYRELSIRKAIAFNEQAQINRIRKAVSNIEE